MIDSEILLLLPCKETIIKNDSSYQMRFLANINHMIKYFTKRGNKIICFTTNETAIKYLYENENITWIDVNTPEDMLFIKMQLSGIYTFPISEKKEVLIELYKKAVEKYPYKRGLTEQQRQKAVLERDNYISRKYIDTFRMIISVTQKNDQDYKFESKAEDGKILIKVNPITLIANAYVSGNPVDITLLLQDKSTGKRLIEWGGYENGIC